MAKTLNNQGKLLTFFEKYKKYRYKKGETILRPDDSPHSVFYIESGFVRVYKITDWGDVKIQIIYAPGQLFPLLWIFDTYPITEFFEAIDEVTVIKIPIGDFTNLLKKNPDLVFELGKYIVSIFKILSQRTDNLMFTDAYSRVIARLLHIARDFGVVKDGAVVLQLPITQKDIAFSLAMTRETASRQLSKLERKRLITYKNHYIIIKDPDKLKGELVISHERKKL